MVKFIAMFTSNMTADGPLKPDKVTYAKIIIS